MAEESLSADRPSGKPACLSIFQRIADAFGRKRQPAQAATDPCDDLKKLSDDYQTAVHDLQAEWSRRTAEVEEQGRKLADAIKRRALPMVGTDDSPSTVLAQNKLINGIGASHRRAYRTADESMEGLVDHAQLLRGLSVLVGQNGGRP